MIHLHVVEATHLRAPHRHVVVVLVAELKKQIKKYTPSFDIQNKSRYRNTPSRAHVVALHRHGCRGNDDASLDRFPDEGFQFLPRLNNGEAEC